MADSRILDLLRRAREGFREVENWFRRGTLGTERTRQSIVENLRRTPASDESKKELLADFFRSEDGQRYDKNDRLQSYNELLGEHRNKENRG